MFDRAPSGHDRGDVPPALEPVDRRLIAWMRRRRVLALRLSLGIVFLWFGLLKLFGQSPVEGLVATTVPWVPTGTLVLLLGVVETAIGVGLLAGRALRVTLALLWIQLAGTFLVFLAQPTVAFQAGNPLLLTEEGEFVVKNLVLIAAGIAVGGSVGRDARPQEEAGSHVRRGRREHASTSGRSGRRSSASGRS